MLFYKHTQFYHWYSYSPGLIFQMILIKNFQTTTLESRSNFYLQTPFKVVWYQKELKIRKDMQKKYLVIWDLLLQKGIIWQILFLLWVRKLTPTTQRNWPLEKLLWKSDASSKAFDQKNVNLHRDIKYCLEFQEGQGLSETHPPIAR